MICFDVLSDKYVVVFSLPKLKQRLPIPRTLHGIYQVICLIQNEQRQRNRAHRVPKKLAPVYTPFTYYIANTAPPATYSQLVGTSYAAVRVQQLASLNLMAVKVCLCNF